MLVNPKTLHVMNGDATRLVFERTGLPGDVVVFADVLHEGPVPAGLTVQAMQKVRAQFWADRGVESFSDVVRRFQEWSSPLDRLSSYDEVVLWFEHDLYDQLLLIRHLDALPQGLGEARLSLVCIGEFPGVEPFYGLGQLSPEQLGPLVNQRVEVSSGQVALGVRAWEAFTAPDPRGLVEMLEMLEMLKPDTSELPFLAGALHRLLQEFPAVGTGLPRTEREILSLLDEGAEQKMALFARAQRREERPFMGDLSFWFRLEHLASGPRPLMLQEKGTGVFSITELGRDVLNGREDWMAVAPFNRWLGGVHLGEETIWRWDEERQAVISEPAA